ncbi:aminoglycoside phosphotransferase family protein [Microbacterium kyungheense]|uniref:Aminoglycoside phosphotransferase (APT) family kinase protein n=1 Tax=Microbacterium kyungheense TaxID=1263636 RepID=A0A543F2D8_9MICO|nr:aminoglycoside phosphotransferase family protein [Microbacterium kyungheense]TQM27997.1 aminoglycoside phosphotransferase (APT) family kinase protein [Microbacterium kyungheense]
MHDKPTAEIDIDTALVRRLVIEQAQSIPHAAELPLEKVAEGWDSEVWRLGAEYAVRLPRRDLAAPLVLSEQRVLPGIAERLAPLGVPVPAPVVCGAPSGDYPWAWSVVRWIEGDAGLDVPRAARAGWADQLAAALVALHTEAPADFPVNPVRGRPLQTRAAAFAERIATARETGVLDEATADALTAAWQEGLRTPGWNGPPVWIHGDLHPGNLVSRDGALAGLIDFGDVTAGDPAYDLAVAWLAFDAAGRARFIAATGAHYDTATWRRAHAWAAAVALVLLVHSDDNPDYFALGSDAVTHVLADPPA